jgi:hypothetical protein
MAENIESTGKFTSGKCCGAGEAKGSFSFLSGANAGFLKSRIISRIRSRKLKKIYTSP